MTDVEKEAYKAGSDSLGHSEDDVAVGHQEKLSWYHKMVSALGAEERGIERVLEEDKNDLKWMNTGTMWLGGNLVIATFDLGVLGPAVFYLSFWECFLTILFFTLLGAVPVAFFSTFGIKTGLRQMVISRYCSGQTVRLFGLINGIACCGWSIVNTIASAQILHVVGPTAEDGTIGDKHHIPYWVAIIIISVLSCLISFCGYDVVHTFEKYTWIPMLAMFIVIAVRYAKTDAFFYGEFTSGRETAGDVLSFGATVYGFATGWASYASDYTVYMPTNTNRVKIFVTVMIGLCTPILFCMILGASVGMAILSEEQTRFYDAYENPNYSVGGLLFEVLVHQSVGGFGQFCMVIIALSTVANNIPNMYSLGLSAQVMWSGFHKVPRPIWTIFGTIITIAVGIPAYKYFAGFMTNFMSIISYWLAIYTSMMISEHFIWRKGFSGYNLDAYDDDSYLPPGFAAAFGFCSGVAGVVVGMAQTWYVGKLASYITLPYGGDIGFELGFGFAFVGFNACRFWERSKFGR